MNLSPTSAILLAGGSSTRMQANTPKQFLQLGDKPLIRHSYDLFLSMPEITEIVVVCDPSYRHLFDGPVNIKPVVFALPGKRRQDSVYNGLLASSPESEYICVHDGARPFIDKELVRRVLAAGQKYQAATVGVPIKFTVKMSTNLNFVAATPDRSLVWEIQTPQVVHRDILLEGFKYAHAHDLTVTDDVSLAELIGKEVKLVEGSHHNLKVTVPADLAIASQLLSMNDSHDT